MIYLVCVPIYGEEDIAGYDPIRGFALRSEAVSYAEQTVEAELRSGSDPDKRVYLGLEWEPDADEETTVGLYYTYKSVHWGETVEHRDGPEYAIVQVPIGKEPEGE